MLKAVILAGGKSTRTYPLTLTRPKPLLPVAGSELIIHNLIQLSGLVDEVIFIVGYKKDYFIESIKKIWGKWGFSKSMSFSFVEQVEQKGTAHAVLQAENIVKKPFFVLNGDDLYSRKDLIEMAELGPSILSQRLPDVSKFSSIKTCENDKKQFYKIIEKPEKGGPGLAGLGMYLFDTDVFDAIRETPISSRGEYEMTQALNRYAENKRIMVHQVKGYWIPVGYPWSILIATENIFKSDYFNTFTKRLMELGYINLGNKIFVAKDSEIEDGVNLIGPVIIGSKVKIKSKSTIRGSSFIDDNCIIGSNVLIESSVIFSSVEINDKSTLSYSVIGSETKIGSACKTVFTNSNNTAVFSKVKGQLESTGIDKLGIICADKVIIGKNCKFEPGVKINPDTIIDDNSNVKKDIL